MSWRSRSTCPDHPGWSLPSSPAAGVLCAVAAGAFVALSPAGALADEPPSPAPPPAPLEVSARAAPARREPGRVSLSAEEAARVPGTGGDPLLAVGSLPGLARPSFDGGKLVVWGAAPGDTRVYVDGVEIPALYHGGGLRGVIGGDLVRSLELVPGAHEASYGRAIGGLVRLRTRDLPAEGVHGFAAADVLDASALITAAVAGGKLRVALAGRISYLDRLLAGVVSPDVGDFVPIPRYHDYQAKVSLALREDEALDLLLLGSGDARGRTVVSADPGAVHRERTTSAFHRAILRYTRTLPDGTTLEVTPFLGRDEESFDASFGPLPAHHDEAAFRYGLRASARVPIFPALAISAGLDAQGSSAGLARAGSLTIPAREGDLYVFGQPPGASVNADRWNSDIVDVAPHVSAELKLGPVTVVPGLRLDGFLIDGSRATPRVGATPAVGFSRLTAAVDPRVSVSWAPSPRIAFNAAAGLHHQPPDAADLSAVFGTPALGLSRATHLTAGQAAHLGAGIDLELTGYYKLLDHLVVRSRLPAPTLAQALVQDGEGRAYGAQVLLRRKLRDGLFGWIAYTLSRSERRYLGDPGYRLLDYDQTHVLSAVASYEIRGYAFGARFRAATGAPRTPVVGSFYDGNAGRFEPVFGAQNSTRLPPFYQLDLRAEKRIRWSRVGLDLSLDVLDVTFHKNAEEIVYGYDYQRKGYVTGLPILAVLGARIVI